MAVTEPIECKQGCGKTFTSEGWRVRHELKCKGKAATEGRIAARDGSPAPIATKAPRTQRKAAKRSKGVARTANKMSGRRPKPYRNPAAAKLAERAYGSSRAEVIADLKERRDRITVAIEALEAVG